MYRPLRQERILGMQQQVGTRYAAAVLQLRSTFATNLKVPPHLERSPSILSITYNSASLTERTFTYNVTLESNLGI